jgi:hypothetical protein
MAGMKWLATILLIGSIGTVLAEDLPESWDGLVEVKSKKMDAAYLMPGADFRPYTKVMIDKTQVAFRKDWLKDQNAQRSVSHKVTDEDATRILAAARENFDDIFVEAFTKAGYEVVTTPGADVLRISTAVVNLYVNAPDVMSAGRSRSYTTEAGEATLVIEVRDSLTGALMGRVLDRRATRSWAQVATSVTNTSDFRALFKQWAGVATAGLANLKAVSPVPEDLKPKQKL